MIERVAIFTDSFLPGVGGTENAVLLYAEELSKYVKVAVFAPDYKKDFDDSKFPFKVYRANSIKITDNDFFALPQFSKDMIKALDEFNPNVIHTETLNAMSSFANSYGKKHNIPVICTVHTKYRCCYREATGLHLLSEIIVRILATCANGADKVFSVSDSMIPELKSYGLKKDKQVTIIRNGCNLVKSDIEKKQNDRFTFLFVGLIVKYKNLELALKSLALVKKVRSDFVFNVVGNGPALNRFKNLAEKLEIGDNVNFIGVVTDRERLKDYYGNADLFLFPSIYDNDPMTVLEAAANGTPSLVTEFTGPSERITDNVTGFIEKNDAESYANRILKLMDDRALVKSVGEKSSDIISSWESNVKSYLDEYEKICKKDV